MRKFIFIVGLLMGVWLVVAIGCSKPPGQREFDTGVFEIKRKNYVRAKALFEKSISKRPGSSENALAYDYIGISCWRLGQLQSAIDAFEDSRRLSPELVDPVYNLGVLHAESGDLARAVDLLQEAARMDPTDSRPLEILGEFYAKRQQWADARRALFGALDRAPQSARILTSIAIVDLSADGPERGLESLMHALEKNSRYAPALFNLGVLYQTQLNHPEQAEPYFKKFLSLVPTGPQAEYARAFLDASKEEPVAPTDAETITTSAATTTSTTAAAAPTVPAVKRSAVDELLIEAARLADKGQTTQALDRCIEASVMAARQKLPDVQEKTLRAAVRLCFDQPRAHYELGRFLIDHGQVEAALKSFKQAVVLNREYSPAYVGLAQAAILTGEMDTALVGLKQAVKADPKNADALWALASLYDEKLGLPDQASKVYQVFVDKFPKDERSAKALGKIRPAAGAASVTATAAPPAQTQTPQSARTAPAAPAPQAAAVQTPRPSERRALPYKRASKRNSAAAAQAFSRGMSYQQGRDLERAIFYYLRSLENDDTLPNTFHNLGICYSVQGDYDLAKESYLRALSLQPNLVDARYNLAVVYRELHDNTSAIQLLREVLKAKPNYAPAYFVMGTLYAEQNPTWPLAKQYYAKFLQLAPNDSSAAYVRDWVAKH